LHENVQVTKFKQKQEWKPASRRFNTLSGRSYGNIVYTDCPIFRNRKTNYRNIKIMLYFKALNIIHEECA